MRNSWPVAPTFTTLKSGWNITSARHGDAMFELGLICPQDCVESVSDALDALDALSVSVEPTPPDGKQTRSEPAPNFISAPTETNDFALRIADARDLG